jgi:hypothetical protein
MDFSRIVRACLGNRYKGILDHAQTLSVFIHNIILSPAPLYRIAEWAQPTDPAGLMPSHSEKRSLNDDRVARSLDALVTPRARTLFFRLALNTIEQFELDTKRIHHDTTTVTFTGLYKASALIIVSARTRVSPVVQTNFPRFEGYIQINQSRHTIVTSSRMRWGCHRNECQDAWGMTRAGMIRTDQNPPNPLFKGEVRLDGGREDRLPAETTNKAEDSNHTPAVMTMHGGPSDVVIVSFSSTSATFNAMMKSAGSFVINCDHGGGHCQAPSDLYRSAWEFMKDHPFGVDPEPYRSGIPQDFPNYCMEY